MTVQSAIASVSEFHAANFVYICHTPLHATWLLPRTTPYLFSAI